MVLKKREFTPESGNIDTYGSRTDLHKLQTYLNKLAKRVQIRQMLFRPDKCQVLKITYRNLILVKYRPTLHDQFMASVTQAKYQRVEIKTYLSWDKNSLKMSQNRQSKHAGFCDET